MSERTPRYADFGDDKTSCQSYLPTWTRPTQYLSQPLVTSAYLTSWLVSVCLLSLLLVTANLANAATVANATVHRAFISAPPDIRPNATGGARTRQIKREHLVSVKIDVLLKAVADLATNDEGYFDIPLSNDQREVASIETTRRGVHGYLQLTGSLVDISDSRFHLVVTDQNIVSGSITLPNQTLRIVPSNTGYHTIQHLDPAGFPAELAPRLAAPSSPGTGNQPLGAARNDEGPIDVLVVYTPQAAASKGGTTAIQAEIDVAMLEANEALLQSNITQVLRLVDSRQVNYTASGDMSDSLSDLTYPVYFGSRLESVHANRDQLGADIVLMITEDSDYCGLAWLMQTPSIDFASEAFGIINKDCITGGSVVVHEIGHIVGLAHNRAANDSSGIADYARGFTAPSGDFRTIMAYNTCQSGPCTLINYFSNPLLSYQGQSLGVLAPSPDAADAARAFDDTAPIVKKFRANRVTRIPTITYPGVGTSLPTVDAGFMWTANGRDVDRWQFWLGNLINSNDLYDSGEIESNTAVVPSLPSDGRTLNGTLRYREAGEWRSEFFIFYANNNGRPQMISPRPDTRLAGTTQRFIWNNGGLEESTAWRIRLLDADGTVLSEKVRNFHTTSVELSGWQSNGRDIVFELTYDTPRGTQTQRFTYSTPGTDLVPRLQLVKSVTPIEFSRGDELTYRFTVSNTGTVPLTGVLVNDEKLGGEMCNVRVLPVGAEQVCSERVYIPTRADLAAGTVTNTASAVSDQIDEPRLDTAVATLVNVDPPIDGPSIAFSTSVTPSQFSRVGERLSYTFTIANTSDVPLTQVIIEDDKLGGIVCSIGSLWSRVSTTCTTSYTVTREDVALGSIETTSLLSARESNGRRYSSQARVELSSVDGQEPVLSVTSEALTSRRVGLNDIITILINVKNNTRIGHTNISVEDLRLGGTVCIIRSLAPGFSTQCTATHKVTRGDVEAGEFVTNTEVTSDEDGTPQTTTVNVDIN